VALRTPLYERSKTRNSVKPLNFAISGDWAGHVVINNVPVPHTLTSQNWVLAVAVSFCVNLLNFFPVKPPETNAGQRKVPIARVGIPVWNWAGVDGAEVATVGFGTGRVGHVLGACAGESVGVSGSR